MILCFISSLNYLRRRIFLLISRRVHERYSLSLSFFHFFLIFIIVEIISQENELQI